MPVCSDLQDSSCLTLCCWAFCADVFSSSPAIHRVGKRLTNRESFKTIVNGRDRDRCSKPFGSIKDRCLTQSGVGREGFLEEGPLELSLEE